MTTPEHPFAKIGAGWTRAADLTRGDRVETAAGGNATVVGVEIREVPPTAVHNMTVSKTHAYFVGPQALLVHNADCGSPSSPRQGRVRQREEDANELREQFRARRAQRKALLAAKRRRQREQHWMTQHPFNDMPELPNCTYCVLAGLSDADTVSTFIRQKNLHPSSARLSLGELVRLLEESDLKSRDTPQFWQFPPSNADFDEARLKVEHDLQNGQPHPTFPFHEQAKQFMMTSSANTFTVGLRYWDGSKTEGHVLLAVKRDDGSILYLDLQKVPPALYDDIDPRSHAALVVPTDVDWRANWQISYAVEHGVHETLLSVDGPAATSPSTPDLEGLPQSPP